MNISKCVKKLGCIKGTSCCQTQQENVCSFLERASVRRKQEAVCLVYEQGHHLTSINKTVE